MGEGGHASIMLSPRRSPWFRHCVGAMDGYHVPVVLPIDMQANYWNRKGVTSINNLLCVDFDRNITYHLVGWEGSCHDARMLVNARERGFSLPTGKFILADAGFRLQFDVLTPYRGVRYHLEEFGVGRSGPQNARELFNLRHSQLRVIVECCIGILKERWHMLQEIPSYSPDMQVSIARAAGVLHNFVRVSKPLVMQWGGFRGGEGYKINCSVTGFISLYVLSILSRLGIPCPLLLMPPILRMIPGPP